ncbi:hypothetical protein EAY16_25430, partial [Vibrio anguillarum]|uniref:hypothetical protein n=1 Tax=Vibrio anguillarum TaxID=55601 RepID=UPI001BE4AB0D
YFFVKYLEINNIYNKFLVSIILVLVPLNFLSNFFFSVFETQHKYYIDGLATKNSIWNYIKTLPENTKIAYSPNIAVPNPYKSIGCHAWQGCAKSTDLRKYNPDVIVYSPK